ERKRIVVDLEPAAALERSGDRCADGLLLDATDAGGVAEHAILPATPEARDLAGVDGPAVRDGEEARPVPTPEHRDHGNARGRRDVHGAGVVSEVQPGGGEQADHRLQVLLSAEPP